MFHLLLALLSVLAGVLLLAKFKKEEMGKLFRFFAWFFIAVGFLLFIGAATHCVCKMACCCDGCGKHDYHKEIVIKKIGHGMEGDACMPGVCRHGEGEKCSHECAGKAKCSPKPGCDGDHRMMEMKDVETDTVKAPATMGK